MTNAERLAEIMKTHTPGQVARLDQRVVGGLCLYTVSVFLPNGAVLQHKPVSTNKQAVRIMSAAVDTAREGGMFHPMQWTTLAAGEGALPVGSAS